MLSSFSDVASAYFYAILPPIRYSLGITEGVAMSADDAIANEQQYILQTYQRPDFVLDRGEGVYLFDTVGRRYLDCVAGIAVNALGYGDPDVARVITEQAAGLIHTSNLYHTRPAGKLARMLVENSFADRVFLSNSGAEANEGALKFARKYAREHHGEGKTTIVAFRDRKSTRLNS